MGVLVDYLKWRGDLSFEAAPFNEVDGAILSLVVYLPLEEVVGDAFGGKRPSIEKICSTVEKKSILMDLTELCSNLKVSSRFKDIRLEKFTNRLKEKKNEQFAAVCARISPQQTAVIFRGTDATIVGWRENMDLAYNDQVPSQKDAVAYLQSAARHYEGDLLVVGHSKGGNLAVYSGAFSNEQTKAKVKAVYNYDGPGFNSNVVEAPQLKEAVPKVHTFVPQNSLIGILLDHAEKYQVIRSENSTGVTQHLPLSWEVQRDHFTVLEEMAWSGGAIKNVLNTWISNLPEEKKVVFIDRLFGLFDEAEINTVGDLKNLKNLYAALKAFESLDDESKGQIEQVIGQLISTAKTMARDDVRSDKEALTDAIKEKFSEVVGSVRPDRTLKK